MIYIIYMRVNWKCNYFEFRITCVSEERVRGFFRQPVFDYLTIFGSGARRVTGVCVDDL